MEERVTSLFQPDTLLPEQYLDTFRRKLHLEPEKKLMLAVLEDAVACYQKYLLARDGKGKSLFRETEDWVLEQQDDWLFSFINVCETLSFEPDYVRQGLLKWKEHKLAEQTQAKVFTLNPERPKSLRGVVGITRSSKRRMRRAASR
jgi:hypothetical protein